MPIHRRQSVPVRPDATKKMEEVLNNYADRIEKMFKSPSAVAAVDYPNPIPKKFTPEQEAAYIASEQYNTRARILETGVAHVVGENYYFVTDVCIEVLQDAARLRKEARAIMERAHDPQL